MSFLKSLGDVALTVGTGGLNKVVSGNSKDLVTGGIYGSAVKDAISPAQNPNQPNYSGENAQAMNNARDIANSKKNFYYGTSLNNLGGETQNYVDSLKGNLNKNVAKADLYNQQNGQARGLAETRAGLSGLDNTALNEGARRRSGMEASAINQSAQANALDLYGKSISNRIEGANKIDNSESALAIAQMKAPETNYQPGLLGGLFGGFLG